MATTSIVSRVDGEGNIGTSVKRWLAGYFKKIYIDSVGSFTILSATSPFLVADSRVTASCQIFLCPLNLVAAKAMANGGKGVYITSVAGSGFNVYHAGNASIGSIFDYVIINN